MDLDTPALTDRVSLREELEAVGIEEVLTQLGRELIGLKPVKTRIRDGLMRLGNCLGRSW